MIFRSSDTFSWWNMTLPFCSDAEEIEIKTKTKQKPTTKKNNSEVWIFSYLFNNSPNTSFLEKETCAVLYECQHFRTISLTVKSVTTSELPYYHLSNIGFQLNFLPLFFPYLLPKCTKGCKGNAILHFQDAWSNVTNNLLYSNAYVFI